MMCVDKMILCDTVAWRRWLYLEFCIACVTGALSQRRCTNDSSFIVDRSFFLGNDTEAHPVQYGDCSFEESMCHYNQFCKDHAAENWLQNGGHAECPGKTGLYESFSVLVSPLLHISHVTCLAFEYTQELPGTLSVYLATTTTLIIVMTEDTKNQRQTFINYMTQLPCTTGKLAFRARSADTNYKVQLRGVKLQPGSCPEPGQRWRTSSSNSTQRMPGTITSVLGLVACKPETTTTFFQSTGSRTREATTGYQSTTSSQSKSEDNNNEQTTPVIAGVAVAVVIVIACIVALVIVVIRKRREKQQGEKGTSDDTKVAGIITDLHNDNEDPPFGMTLVEIKDTQVFSKPDVGPYDVAEDGLPGLTRSVVIDNCGRIPSPEDKTRSCSSSQDSHKQSKEPSEMYSQVHKKKTETADVYSQIHKKNKETLNKSLDQSSEAGSFISPLHTPKIFEHSDRLRPLAMANTEDKQEYNALNFEQHRQVRKSSSPREATRQTYNHIHGDVPTDYAKVKYNRQGANMVVDAENDHLGT